jgi:hypothetical protein
MVGLTNQCGDIGAGPLTAKFQDDVQMAVDMAAAAGKQLCTGDNLTGRITPCLDGIVPVEWPNQDHSVCMPIPANCAL